MGGNPWRLSEGTHDHTTLKDPSALFHLTMFPGPLAVSNTASTFWDLHVLLLWASPG